MSRPTRVNVEAAYRHVEIVVDGIVVWEGRPEKEVEVVVLG